VADLRLETGGGPPALALGFRLAGDLAQLAVPPCGPGRRTDGLWRHTCFELFLRQRQMAGYFELNVSPSTDWAAYVFEGYRAGMRPLELPAPRIDVTAANGELVLTAFVPLAAFTAASGEGLEAGLAAVIEARDGTLSYWALAHPDPLRPDFHHPGSFVHEIRY
jgi:hypothetical protein